MSKEQILQRIRRGINNPVLMVDRKRQLPKFTPDAFDPTTLVSAWRQELEALTGQVYGPLSHKDALQQLVKSLKIKEADKVMIWDDAQLPISGVAAGLQDAGIEIVPVDMGSVDNMTLRSELEQVPVGISGAIAGLAETGSIIVDSGAGRPRTASLVPRTHIALLRVADLYPDLPTWMALQGQDMLSSTANIVVITGPSKTADIELNLVIGVHGPGEVQVILVE
jgi:L-lactate dehydrogenase complex protein LldG